LSSLTQQNKPVNKQ